MPSRYFSLRLVLFICHAPTPSIFLQVFLALWETLAAAGIEAKREHAPLEAHSEIQRVFISLSRASHQFISISFFVALPIKNTVSHADKFFVTSEYTDLYLLLMSAVMRTSISEQKELTELFLSTLYIVFIVSQKVFFIQK